MGKPRLEQLTSTHFRCANGHEFESSPDQVEDMPEWDWHPFKYSCKCPECDLVADQDSRYRGLLKAHARATGPKTPEGKAMSSANLDGHPTPEESQKIRFNAITHGLNARVANYYPAKPGKYTRCDSCDYYGNECIENAPSPHKNPIACLSRVELFMQHRMAFDTGDAGLLTALRSDTQAGVQAIINDIILDITQRGVTLTAPQWKINQATGKVVIADYIDPDNYERVVIHEVKAHPLLKILIEYISKNNLSLEDMNMTPKVQSENELMTGYLDGEKTEQESQTGFRDKVLEGQKALMKLIDNSHDSDMKVVGGQVFENG